MSNYALGLLKKNDVMLICHKLDCHGEDLRRNRVAFKNNETVFWNFNTNIMKFIMFCLASCAKIVFKYFFILKSIDRKQSKI